MSDRSPNLDMPYLMPSQAQKHVTHNQALQQLDAIVQLSVLAFDAVIPPSAPEPGERYALGTGPTGDWAGHDDKLALWDGTTWLFITPQEGWRAWGDTESELRIFQGASWRIPEVAKWGINTSADTTNRLAVAADATLLTHDGNDHQLKLNKAASGDTASLLFQSNWMGHAEMGLAGDDNWSLKVSPDGNGWTEALSVNSASGLIEGTAVQENYFDSTAGRLLKVGAFGLGASGQSPISDLDTLLDSGFYHAETNITQNMPISSANQNAVLVGKANVNNGFQIFANRSTDSILWRLYEAGSWKPWNTLFDQKNILGSVSQNGGSPTGAIIEQDSNANGNYVKWADGTMICHRNSMGTVSGAAATWIFPAGFVSAPTVSAQPLGSAACFATIANRDAGSVEIHSFDHNGADTATPDVDLIATGRWF